MLRDLFFNFAHNLFKPLLLFFYAGFLIPILRVKFDFPKPVYQALTIFLLLCIGWHGGQELAKLDSAMYLQVAGFMALGFCANLMVGSLAYLMLRYFTKLRQIDAATIAGYYGSDSAGTFATAKGFLESASIAYGSYMPVMLAVMEIPGCIVALFLTANMRRRGMDAKGNMPGEKSYITFDSSGQQINDAEGFTDKRSLTDVSLDEELTNLANQADEVSYAIDSNLDEAAIAPNEVDTRSILKYQSNPRSDGRGSKFSELKSTSGLTRSAQPREIQTLSTLLHEVFLNSGIYLLFAGIVIGFIGQLQGTKIVGPNDKLFNDLFAPLLCIFLLEMGITASKRLKDLRRAGISLVVFALLAPNLFAMFGLFLSFGFSYATGVPLELGTYVLFAVLCGSSSYIALPAVQQMAIPEASPTLPLAASLGVTFSYNVTIGITLYTSIAEQLVKFGPVANFSNSIIGQ